MVMKESVTLIVKYSMYVKLQRIKHQLEKLITLIAFSII